MDCYDPNQEDSFDKNRDIKPVQIRFSDNSKYIYNRPNSVGTKPDMRLCSDVTKYSAKVHTFAWVTIASAILGLSLSALGIAIHNRSIGLLSLLSISICGIALLIWIECPSGK
jgi:hypothetical protein